MDHVDFRAPQITKFMILSLHGHGSRRSSRRHSRSERGVGDRAREGSGDRSGACGCPCEGVRRQRADCPAEATDRQARAPDLRPAVRAFVSSDPPVGAYVRRTGGRCDGGRTRGGAGCRQDHDCARVFAHACRAPDIPRASSPPAGCDRSADVV